jgi:hypothetical protein
MMDAHIHIHIHTYVHIHTYIYINIYIQYKVDNISRVYEFGAFDENERRAYKVNHIVDTKEIRK